MSSWTLHREATPQDWERYIRTCATFVLRYGSAAGMRNPQDWIDDAIHSDDARSIPSIAWYVVDNADPTEQARLRAILRKRIRRALDHLWAEGIGYGHVGWRA